MSVEALNWARKMGAVAQLSPAQLLLLWMIADRANKEWACWDSISTLARESNQNKRSVQRHLKVLEDLDIIRRYERRGAYRNFETGEVYENVRLSDLIELQESALARWQDGADGSGSRDPFESASAVVGDRVSDTGDGQGDNLSPWGDESVSAGQTQGDKLSPRVSTGSGGQGDKLSPRVSTGEHRAWSDQGDKLSPRGAPRQFVQGQGDNSCTPEGDLHSIPRARNKNPHIDPSSSSSVRRGGASGVARDDDRRGRKIDARWRGVYLERLDQVIAEHAGVSLSPDQLRGFIDVVLDRAGRRVGRPTEFVSAAVRNDPGEVRAFVVESDQASPQSPDPCPIREHAMSGYLAVNCPSCRKFDDFPHEIDSVTFKALDPGVQDRIRVLGIPVVSRHAEAG